MTEDERNALLEQIACICEPEGFYHGRLAVPSHRARGLAKAAVILAAIEPAIRADERKRSEDEVERLRAALQAFADFDALSLEVKRPDIFELKVRRPILAALNEDKP